MVAKFLDDNKPKTSLKKWICITSDLINRIQFQLICQMLAKYFVVESERTLFRFRKRKKNSVLFTYFIKRAREISKFHVVVVLRRLGNVQKSVMHVQSCCFANLNLLLFCRSRCRCHRRCLSSLLLWSKNFGIMVTWRHTSFVLMGY